MSKPLVVDGSAESHVLSLAYDQLSLSRLHPPLVLQEFVNHGILLLWCWINTFLLYYCRCGDIFFFPSCWFTGGVLFKVYIVGDTIKVVRRFSLPDVDEHDLVNNSGVFEFPRVSCASASAEEADLDPSIAGKDNVSHMAYIY